MPMMGLEPAEQSTAVGEKPAKRLTATHYYLISLLGGIGLWLGLALTAPKLVPSPWQVWLAARSDWVRGVLLPDFLFSVFRVATGFFAGSVLGIAVGMLMGWYRPIRHLLEPWIQFLRMLPSIAIIPLVIVYFGVGETAKIMVIFLSVFLTMVIAAFQGVVEVDPILVRAARVLGASDRQLFLSVIVPYSLPYILVGFRLGLAAGWTTVVAAELIAASHGLGYLVQVAGEDFDMANVYLGIIIIGLVGLGMDELITFVQYRLTPWQPRVGR